ncbi:sugar ABC transporter permease [Chromobacterium sp. F49]|nr:MULTISPECIES: ABC transporter permease [Chromobacterium]KUM01616.1 sugar ABC transporter permease [Chromobacterium subtsugae]KZE87732.1 sugar ABC transporter permease [Chromobacterium sp. F49]OBU86731.1 sugar ABC transporter permease [Chromobacterium subtsugae]WSE89929.1 ABC transporter permease [Chromobacterium subtsugae]WVH58300.1 ABC transporter permease [Chromobacterium subtsugae]
MKFGQPSTLPRWAQLTILPALNLLAALLVTGFVTWMIGENPWECLQLLIHGAFGYGEGAGYTLFYTTSYIFAGLAVATAFHAGLFNIGGEGQAYLAGLGVTLVMLGFDHTLPSYVLIPLAVLAAMGFGAAWAYIPAYLQAKRGSHIVVTTIMFNFIAYSLMLYLISHQLIEAGSQNPTTRQFAETGWIPQLHTLFSSLPNSPLNLTFVLALLASALFYLIVWHSRWGFELRTVGTNEHAAGYAGMSVSRVIIIAMCVSGALAGLSSVNDLLGSSHRMNVLFTNGVGFVGIAVALMGRNHPVGIILSALLFGALTQGGSDLSFEKPMITREMILFIQGLIILFCGALENLFEPFIAGLFKRKDKK